MGVDEVSREFASFLKLSSTRSSLRSTVYLALLVTFVCLVCTALNKVVTAAVSFHLVMAVALRASVAVDSEVIP